MTDKMDLYFSRVGLYGAYRALSEADADVFNDSKKIQDILLSVCDTIDADKGYVFHPVRVALSGQEKSPPPQELAMILGREETLERLKNGMEVLGADKSWWDDWMGTIRGSN